MTVAIITAIYDDYDVLKPALPQVGVDVEWICVTDREREPNGWRIVVEPQLGVHPNLASKVPKCVPWCYTAAPLSIWLDGSFRVVSERFAAEAAACAAPIAQYVHPARSCIYQESDHCSDQPKYRSQSLHLQTAWYRRHGHPEDWGLWAAGVIAIRNTDPAVRLFGAQWLEHIRCWSFQDQISEPFCLRRAGLRPVSFPGSLFDGNWVSYEGSNRHAATIAQ